MKCYPSKFKVYSALKCLLSVDTDGMHFSFPMNGTAMRTSKVNERLSVDLEGRKLGEGRSANGIVGVGLLILVII